MTTPDSLSDLDEAHQRARAEVRARIELAEDCIAYYRSKMWQLQEDFRALAQVEGFADAPGFRAELSAVGGRADESVWEASRVIARFTEEDDDLRHRHRLERERFLEHRQRDP